MVRATAKRAAGRVFSFPPEKWTCIPARPCRGGLGEQAGGPRGPRRASEKECRRSETGGRVAPLFSLSTILPARRLAARPPPGPGPGTPSPPAAPRWNGREEAWCGKEGTCVSERCVKWKGWSERGKRRVALSPFLCSLHPPPRRVCFPRPLSSLSLSLSLCLLLHVTESTAPPPWAPSCAHSPPSP